MNDRLVNVNRIICCLVIGLSLFTYSAPVYSMHDSDTHKEDADIKGQLGNWMSHYYLKKNPNEVNHYLKILQEHQKEIWPTRGRGFYALMGFFTGLFADNPGRAKEWMSSQKFTGDLEEALTVAEFNNTPNEKWSEGIRQAMKDGTVHSSLMFVSVDNPGVLDAMWGAFFASGNVDYVGKILEVLRVDYKWRPGLDDQMIMVIKAAATWSLLSNMEQHKLVNEFVEGQAKADTPMGEAAKLILSAKKQ